jgi:hypothetical protein
VDNDPIHSSSKHHYAIFRCVLCRSTITSVYIGRYILLLRFGSAAITIVSTNSPFLDGHFLVMFVLPFFDTQLFLDDCFSFSRHNKKKKRKLSFWDDAYAAGVWTIDEPMQKNSKGPFGTTTYGMACDRLCSTLWQQRRWMVLLVAYSLAEALQSSARACGSWFSRVYRDFLVREPRIYTVDEHMYVLEDTNSMQSVFLFTFHVIIFSQI